MATVSVCIPTYNQIENFKRAFESVISQEYSDYEIIVTDDSTNDEISNYLQFRNSPHVVRYYKNSPRLGAPANWNRAISLAKGKYIKILHHDDWLHSNLVCKNLLLYFRKIQILVLHFAPFKTYLKMAYIKSSPPENIGLQTRNWPFIF